MGLEETPWAADTDISMPNPKDPNNQVEVPMFGFVFTENGLFHDLTVAQHETLSQPSFGPPLQTQDVVRGDTEVDQ